MSATGKGENMAEGTSPDAGDQHRNRRSLLSGKPKVINVGLEAFADELKTSGAAVVHVAWVPPAGGNAKLAALLSKLGS